MVCKLKTVRADMLVLQCQLERELIRYVRRYLCQPQVTIITNDKQFAFMCELYDYVENTELPPEMVSSLMKTKNVLELSWDEWLMNAEVEDMEDSIEKVAELLRKGNAVLFLLVNSPFYGIYKCGTAFRRNFFVFDFFAYGGFRLTYIANEHFWVESCGSLCYSWFGNCRNRRNAY